jgi:hypothetical protein
MNLYHFSSQSSAHFEFNVDSNLNLLNNKIVNEGEGLSVQQNINALNDLECNIGMGSMGIPSIETSKVVIRVKTFVV